MIHYFVPGRGDKNIGKALNDHCALVKDANDWICTMDGDMMFLVPFWPKQIEDIIAAHGDKYAILGPVTNRLASTMQRPFPDDMENYDMLHHKAVADWLFEKKYDKVVACKRPLAGVMLLFQKHTWERFHFSEKNIAFDTAFSQAAMRRGLKLGLMEGLYVFHGYRMGQPNPAQYKAHLQ